MIRLNQQKGSVLIISLVLLLVATILGLSSMNNTIMEEKMVGNLLQNNQSFQMAEDALRQAENTIMGWNNGTKPEESETGATGVWALGRIGIDAGDAVYDPVWWDDADRGKDWWQDTADNVTVFSVTNAEGFNGYYVIEYEENVCDSLGTGTNDTSYCDELYRITAMGLGPGDRSMSLLRSTVARRF